MRCHYPCLRYKSSEATAAVHGGAKERASHPSLQRLEDVLWIPDLAGLQIGPRTIAPRYPAWRRLRAHPRNRRWLGLRFPFARSAQALRPLHPCPLPLGQSLPRNSNRVWLRRLGHYCREQSAEPCAKSRAVLSGEFHSPLRRLLETRPYCWLGRWQHRRCGRHRLRGSSEEPVDPAARSERSPAFQRSIAYRRQQQQHAARRYPALAVALAPPGLHGL